MVNFVFFGEISAKINPLCEELVYAGVQSVNLLLNETWGDTAYGKVARSFGADHITEELLGNKFLVNANTFFQTNVESAERIFSLVLGKVGEGENVLDLYCGVGAISIALAQKCGRVVGIESSFESVSSARRNAVANGAGNASFICWNVDRMVGHMRGFDTFIIDPPRAGMNPKAINGVLGLGPRKIIYVSCNPETLCRDIKMLEGYETKELLAFDQFPQTLHMEMLAVLEKKPVAAA